MNQVPRPPFELHDLRWEEPARLSALDRFFLPRLRDRRDLVQIRSAARLTVEVALPGLLLFVPGVFRWWLVPPYLLWWLLHVGPYVLLLHALSHRKTFKPEHAAWDHWVPTVLGPFFGQTPGSYYAHHMGMHHAEGNLLSDLSTTMPYQRDSLRHWLHYLARFYLGSYRNLPAYFKERKRDKMYAKWLRGEVGWLVFVLAAALVSWQATLAVFVLPLLIIRVLFMCGNWAQHAFVDVDDPDNPYRNSTTLINARYNHKCFNDGYHIVHHLRPSMHWSEMPTFFEENWREFAANDAVVFDGLGNNQTVWWCLMRHDYDTLAEHLLDWPDNPRTHAEKVAFLKSRTRPRRGRIRGVFEPAPPPGAEA